MPKRKISDAMQRRLDENRIILDEVGQVLERDIRIRAADLFGRPEAYMRDAIASKLLSRALEYAVNKAIYKITNYTVWRDIFPLDTDMPAGAASKVYKIWSRAGMAQWYRGGGRHPNVAIGVTEVEIPFHNMTTAFTIDYLEMMASNYAGVNTEAEKAAACMEALDNMIEELVFLGDATVDRPGVIDHPNITEGAMPTGDWDDTATAAQIIADCQYGIDQVANQSKNDKKFKSMLVDIMLSPELYRIISSRIANTYTDETIEKVLRKADGKFGQFIESPMHGTTEGGAGDNVSFGPFSDPDTNVVSLSLDGERLPPDDRGMIVEQPFASKFGRYHLKYPLRTWQGNNAV